MDVKAFGSYYGQSATLPYASGFVVASGTNANFPSCRALYTQASSSTAAYKLVIVPADGGPTSAITLNSVRSDQLIPLSCTTISGTSTIDSVVVLY
jgi:hypothetical protein